MSHLIPIPQSIVRMARRLFLTGDSGKIEDILQTARIYSGVFGKALGWRSAVGLHCKFNRYAV